MKIEIEVDNIKMAREALCLAQMALHESDANIANSVPRRIGMLIKELDKHRPLGPDGKHGDLHTPTCGCEDKPMNPERIARLRNGDWNFGCLGRRPGGGHEHDEFCAIPSDEEIEAAGLDVGVYRTMTTD